VARKLVAFSQSLAHQRLLLINNGIRWFVAAVIVVVSSASRFLTFPTGMFISVWNNASIGKYYPPLLAITIAVSLLPEVPALET